MTTNTTSPTTKACAGCAQQFEENRLLIGADGHYCDPCYEAANTPTGHRFHPLVAAGTVGALAPFFFHFSYSGERFYDFVALGGGALAVVGGSIGLLLSLKKGGRRGLAVASAICVVLLGAYQVARGFGLA
jgi:hypothetical protein